MIAESTIRPKRLIQSKGKTNYNYNLHSYTTDEGNIMYRYNYIPIDGEVTIEKVQSLLPNREIDLINDPEINTNEDDFPEWE